MQLKPWLVVALLVSWATVAQPTILLAAGGAAALLGAATIGAGAVGAGVLGLGALTAAKAGLAVAVGKGLVGTVALGAGKAGLAKAGLVKAGIAKAGLAKAGLVKAGVAKAGLVKAGVAKAGLAKAGLVKAGVAKAGLAKAGLVKAGLGKLLSSYSSSYDSSEQGGSFGQGGSYSSSNEQSSSYGGSISIDISKKYRREAPGPTEMQEMLLRDAFALDQERPCGLRLACELATRRSGELAEDERLIVRLLQRPHSLDSVAVHYDEAVLLGRTSGPNACARVYQRCDLDAVQVMQLLRGSA